MMQNKKHWQTVYQNKLDEQVSWHQTTHQDSIERLLTPLTAIEATSMVDVGAGRSTFAFDLMAALPSLKQALILDISDAALQSSQQLWRQRTNDNPTLQHRSVSWQVADITQVSFTQSFSFWHDRAVLHFLTEKPQQTAYAQRLNDHVVDGGLALISTFAVGGPEKCSGLPIQQYDVDRLLALVGERFECVENYQRIHQTPWKSEQRFHHFLLRKHA